MDTVAAEKEFLYLYCVTNKIPELKGIDDLVDPCGKDFGAGVYFTFCQGLYAIVSKVKGTEFQEESLKKNLADLEWVKDRVTVHEEVIEGIMKNSDVVPFKFATIFNNADNLKAMLDKHSEDFKTNLRNLKNKEEWGVKIYCDIERLKGTVIREEAGILKIEKEINSSSSGKAYFLKKKKEELMKEAVNKRINEYGQESFELFKILSYEARINKLLPKEVTEREDDMVLNSAFLVDKDKVLEFIHAVDDLKTRYDDKGFDFDCTGPWPPYNFCNLSKEKLQNG